MCQQGTTLPYLPKQGSIVHISGPENLSDNEFKTYYEGPLSHILEHYRDNVTFKMDYYTETTLRCKNYLLERDFYDIILLKHSNRMSIPCKGYMDQDEVDGSLGVKIHNIHYYSLFKSLFSMELLTIWSSSDLMKYLMENYSRHG